MPAHRISYITAGEEDMSFPHREDRRIYAFHREVIGPEDVVIYDISDDNIRLRVSEICKDFGLSRIQKSAFLGDLTSSRRKELITALRKALGEEEGNIHVFVICRADFALRVIIGKPTVKEEAEGIVVV